MKSRSCWRGDIDVLETYPEKVHRRRGLSFCHTPSLVYSEEASESSPSESESLVPRKSAHPNSRTRPSSTAFFTPATTPIPRSRGYPFIGKKSFSSPLLHSPTASFDYNSTHSRMKSDSEEDEDVIYTSWNGPKRTDSSSSIRTRIFKFAGGSVSGKNHRDKLISTKPGEGAGETETEIDEPPRHLPTARKVASSTPLVPPTTLQQLLTPLLFEFSRFLSIFPAVFGTLYNLYHVFNPPAYLAAVHQDRRPPERVDFAVSALWAILTGYQCFCLATGLLGRWRVYYPPLATLIRLLALQAICWPATHFTLTIFEHEKRPVITWAAIGTTTSLSRSIQLWVTSNLWWEDDQAKRWRGGKWGGRRWDWREVGLKCVLPAGIVYCIMAWAEQLRREWSGC